VQTRLEIAKLHEDIGSASMIYVTHDQVEAMTLADKIVLLHTGELIQERGSVAQFGTPMTLYHRPASLFVAEFIGSPKMNILPAKLLGADGESALVETMGQRAHVAVDARHLATGDEVKLGIRPEHIVVSDQGEGAGLPVTVKHVERLGDASLLYVDVGTGGPAVFTVRVEGSTRPQGGTRLTLRLLPNQLHLFDSSGQACKRTVDLPD
jgi:multiple sugar transport system ATP-binding protein